MAYNISDSSETLNDLVSSGKLENYQPEIQSKLIDGLSNSDVKAKDGGWMGRVFGNKKENAVMHIALTICLLLAAIGVFCTQTGTDQWDVIIPAITTGMGYIFGRGDK